MKKRRRIKTDKDFQYVFKKGVSIANRQFVVYSTPITDQSAFRIGLSVSKKVGNAVIRNRIKRYIRQAFLELDPFIMKNVDIIVIARIPVSNFTFFEVKNSLIHVLKKGNLVDNKKLAKDLAK